MGWLMLSPTSLPWAATRRLLRLCRKTQTSTPMRAIPMAELPMAIPATVALERESGLELLAPAAAPAEVGELEAEEEAEPVELWLLLVDAVEAATGAVCVSLVVGAEAGAVEVDVFAEVVGAGAGVEVDGADGVAGAAGEDVAGAGAGVALVDGAEAAGGAAAAALQTAVTYVAREFCTKGMSGAAQDWETQSRRPLR